MAGKGSVQRGGGNAGSAPAWTPPPMAPGGWDGKETWRRGDGRPGGDGEGDRARDLSPAAGASGGRVVQGAAAPGAECQPPAPGTPYNDRGAVIVSTDPCVIYDPDIERNEMYLKSMTVEDVEKYKGQWIAIADGGVVAHGTDPLRVCGDGNKAGKGDPLMHFVQVNRGFIPFFIPKK